MGCCDYSPEVRSKMLAECRGILANKAEPRRPGPLEKKVSAVGFSDASSSGMAWTFHSQSRMFLRTVPFALQQHDSIFKAELQAMVAGQKELMEDMNENESYVWCGDNQAAIYVSRRGLTCVWNLNKMLRELFILKTSKKVGCVLVRGECRGCSIAGGTRDCSPSSSMSTSSWKMVQRI